MTQGINAPAADGDKQLLPPNGVPRRFWIAYWSVAPLGDNVRIGAERQLIERGFGLQLEREDRGPAFVCPDGATPRHAHRRMQFPKTSIEY